MKKSNLKENQNNNMIRNTRIHKNFFNSLLALTFLNPLAVKAEPNFDEIVDQRCVAEESTANMELKIEKRRTHSSKETSSNLHPFVLSSGELISVTRYNEGTIHTVRADNATASVEGSYKDLTTPSMATSVAEVIPNKAYYIASSPALYILLERGSKASVTDVVRTNLLDFSGGSMNIVKIRNNLYTLSSDGDLRTATLGQENEVPIFTSLGNFGKAQVLSTFLQLMRDDSLTWTTGDGKIVNYNPESQEVKFSSLTKSSPLWGKFSGTSTGNFIFTQRSDINSASTDVVLTGPEFKELARLKIGETPSAARISRISENRYAIPGLGGQAIIFDSNLKLVRPIAAGSAPTGRYSFGSSQILAVPNLKDTFIYTDPSGNLQVIDSNGNIKMHKKIAKELGPLAISSSGAILLTTTNELIWAKLEMSQSKKKKIIPCAKTDGTAAEQNLSETPEIQPATSQLAPAQSNGSNVPKVNLYDL